MDTPPVRLTFPPVIASLGLGRIDQIHGNKACQTDPKSLTDPASSLRGSSGDGEAAALAFFRRKGLFDDDDDSDVDSLTEHDEWDTEGCSTKPSNVTRKHFVAEQVRIDAQNHCSKEGTAHSEADRERFAASATLPVPPSLPPLQDLDLGSHDPESGEHAGEAAALASSQREGLLGGDKDEDLFQDGWDTVGYSTKPSKIVASSGVKYSKQPIEPPTCYYTKGFFFTDTFVTHILRTDPALKDRKKLTPSGALLVIYRFLEEQGHDLEELMQVSYPKTDETAMMLVCEGQEYVDSMEEAEGLGAPKKPSSIEGTFYWRFVQGPCVLRVF